MLHLIALPALDDNYIWYLRQSGHAGVLIDPGDAEVVVNAVEAGLAVTAVLVTHHHSDHVAAIEQLQARYNWPVYAPADSRIPGQIQVVSDGDRIAPPGTELTFEVIATPGHTLSHIAWYGEGHLFCGDALFSLGCGRLFEGSAAQMHESLQRIARLPDDILLCPAHEYTEANARFALHVDPHNEALQARAKHVGQQRASGHPSLPVRLLSERQCNPFLRVLEPSIRMAVEQHWSETHADPTHCFAGLRRWKDEFR